ncbi:MAG: peptidylprolyl isomerase [Clostridiales Family XIII bacterium]|jgi:parvulin-like peptidyl-prolyl isomerase|nr:peptidylprolyl isomerase [Clostridiales Family XIII bacterium]
MKKKNAGKCKIAIAVQILALSALLLLSGCGGGASENSEITVAKVGDIEITEDRLNAFTELLFSLYGYDLASLEDSERNLYKAETLDTLVQAAAAEQYYKAKGVEPNIEEDFTQIKADIEQSEGLADSLKEKGVTDDILRYFLEAQYYFQTLQEEFTQDGALPSEDEILAYYAAHEQEYPDEEERRVSHILVGDANHTDEDRQLAEEIRGKIASGEASFEDMAAEYGTDGTSSTGGDLGYAVRSAYVPEFSDVAFVLPQDELSGIVESEFGFHLLKVTDIRSTRSLETQRESIRTTLGSALYEDALASVLATYEPAYLNDKYPSPEARAAAAAAGAVTEDAAAGAEDAAAEAVAE